MTILPTEKRLLVQKNDSQKETSFGFVYNDDGSYRCEEGEVIAVGPEVKGVVVGDRILFSKYGPDEIIVDGKKHYIINESVILAVVR